MKGNDMTKRKDKETTLQESHKALKETLAERTAELQNVHLQLLHAEKLSSLGKLVASIAHEFGNSIFGIRNMMAAIKGQTAIDEESAEVIDLTIQECDRMKNLLVDLQGFNLPTKRTCVFMNIHENIDRMIFLCQNHLKARKIMVTRNYDHSIPGIYAIPDQIKQVLLNLLNNAGEAIPDSGGTISITTQKMGDAIAIHINDSGKGIDPEVMPHIFTPFFTTKSESKNSGLGLPVISGIITNHGGKIEVASESGQGTIFSIFLPIDRRIPTKSSQPKPAD